MENVLVIWLFLLNVSHITIQGKEMINLGHIVVYHITISILISTYFSFQFHVYIFLFLQVSFGYRTNTRTYFLAQMHVRMQLACIINSNIIYKYISSQKEVNKLSIILHEMARPRFHLWYLVAARAGIFVIIFDYIFIIHLKYHQDLTKYIRNTLNIFSILLVLANQD